MSAERDFGATIARDWGVIDRRYEVTFVSKASAGDETRTVGGVQKYQITREELLKEQASRGEGLYTGEEEVFELPADPAAWSGPVVAPKEGDTITLDGVTRSVLDVFTIAWDSVFQCVCLKER